MHAVNVVDVVHPHFFVYTLLFVKCFTHNYSITVSVALIPYSSEVVLFRHLLRVFWVQFVSTSCRIRPCLLILVLYHAVLYTFFLCICQLILRRQYRAPNRVSAWSLNLILYNLSILSPHDECSFQYSLQTILKHILTSFPVKLWGRSFLFKFTFLTNFKASTKQQNKNRPLAT